MPPQLQLGKTTLYRPQIDFSLGASRIFRDLNFKLGLDLQGGTHLSYEANFDKIDASQKDTALLSTKDNIERRVNLLGVSEAIVQTSKVGDKYHLIVELPGVKDINQALATIGTTAQLDFREAQDATPGAEVTFTPTNLTGSDLKTAQVQFNGTNNTASGAPGVSLEFTPEGAKKFAEITKRNIGKPLAIFLDNRPVTAPTVQNEIQDGRAIISGNFTIDQAKSLSIQLTAGSLPVPIRIVEQKNIGATLGTESVVKSLFAGLVGLVLIWLFMVINYGFKGFIANITLTLYILISLCLFKLMPVTLTLAGIAGFILSVGMAVDANILIFERMKEELKWGRPLRAALELAFQRAWTSVRDSNVSSIITASILFWFGSGSVRGFAMTLIIGILVSLFTSVTITRSLMRLIYSRSK
jgi:preprotein translocase subunit SecD